MHYRPITRADIRKLGHTKQRPYLTTKTLRSYYDEASECGITIMEYSPEECSDLIDCDGFYVPKLWKGRFPTVCGIPCPPRSIVMRQNFPNFFKLFVLFHEMGHDRCFESGCACSYQRNGIRRRNDFSRRKIEQQEIKSELHAWKYAIKRLRREGLSSILCWTKLKAISVSFVDSSEGIAVKRMIKTKWWKTHS